MAEGKEEGLFGDSDMMPIVMLVMGVVMLAVVIPTTLTPITQTLQAQALAQLYQGVANPRTVKVTNKFSWINLVHEYPFTPWISAFFINDGPSAVEVGINYPDNRFTINPNETRTITRTGAEERIKILFFVCYPGLNASVRVEGEY